MFFIYTTLPTRSKEDAVAALKNFYEGKKLLPSNFMENNRVEAIQPMYVPFWLFDVDVYLQAEFHTEKIKKETHDPLIGSKYTTTEKRFFRSRRAFKMRFEKIPADGSKKMDDDYMDSIEPFDFGELVPFSAAYMAGYLADKYDVSARECLPRIDERLKNTMMELVTNNVKETFYGRDDIIELKDLEVDQHKHTTYLMVPVWILTTRYEDKPYTFMMNGQTGKVVGELPYDGDKALFYPAWEASWLPILYFIVAFTDDSGEMFNPLGILFLFIYFGAYFSIKRSSLIAKLKNIAHATKAADYLKKDSVELVESHDKFLIYEFWRNDTLKEASDDPNKGSF